MKTLKDLFEHQIKDLYSAESQLIKAIPEMVENSNHKKLKESFESHLEETKEHKERLVKICDELGIKPSGEECKAMKGLIEEAKSFLDEDAETDVRDAGIIAEAQRIEHYEISGYGTAVRYAKELGLSNIARALQKTLDEEYNADQTLDDLAIAKINAEAK